jgi:cell division protein FtsB
MEAKTFALVELLVFASIALGLGFWQLWSINRTLKKSRAETAELEARQKGGGEGQ